MKSYKRKVLFIAYYFPPIGGGGVQRSAKFVKYLPEYGWIPYVISTERAIDMEGYDESLLGDIPEGVLVHRIATPDPLSGLLPSALGRISRFLHSPGKGSSIGEPGALPENSQDNDSPRSRRVRNGVSKVRRCLGWPLRQIADPPIDRYIYWSIRIVPLAVRLVRTHELDIIYTTSAPWSAHLAGMLISKLTRRPWVADFRDPWTGNQLAYHRGGIRLGIDRYFEKLFLRHAKAVIAVTPLQLEGLRERAPEGAKHKFHVITNGYDSSDFAYGTTRVNRCRRPIEIVHAGVIYAGTIEPLLRAVELLLAETDIADELRVLLIGHVHPPARRRIDESLARLVIEIKEPVPHRDVIELIRSSTANLLILGNSSHWSTIYTGKLFELMACGTPIIAIAPEGVAADLVRESRTGCVCNPDDPKSLADVLRTMIRDYPSFLERYYSPRYDVIRRYDRRATAEELAGLFDGLLAR